MITSKAQTMKIVEFAYSVDLDEVVHKELIVLHSLNSQYNTHVVWIKQSFGHSADIKILPSAVYFFGASRVKQLWNKVLIYWGRSM